MFGSLLEICMKSAIPCWISKQTSVKGSTSLTRTISRMSVSSQDIIYAGDAELSVEAFLHKLSITANPRVASSSASVIDPWTNLVNTAYIAKSGKEEGVRCRMYVV